MYLPHKQHHVKPNQFAKGIYQITPSWQKKPCKPFCLETKSNTKPQNKKEQAPQEISPSSSLAFSFEEHKPKATDA